MTDKELQLIYDVRILTLFADVLDWHCCNMEEHIVKSGKPFRGKLKTRVLAFRKCVQSLRNMFMLHKGTDEKAFKEADMLCKDSARMYALLMLIADRCGEETNDNLDFKIYNMIKNSTKSKLNYDLTGVEKNAFLE